MPRSYHVVASQCTCGFSTVTFHLIENPVKKYLIDAQFPRLLAAVGIDTGEVLRLTHLPEDLFSRPEPVVAGPEYLRLMEAVGQLASDNSLPVRMATAEGIEQFSPPIFAAMGRPVLSGPPSSSPSSGRSATG